MYICLVTGVKLDCLPILSELKAPIVLLVFYAVSLHGPQQTNGINVHVQCLLMGWAKCSLVSDTAFFLELEHGCLRKIAILLFERL